MNIIKSILQNICEKMSGWVLTSLGTGVIIIALILFDEFDDEFEILLPLFVGIVGVLILLFGLSKLFKLKTCENIMENASKNLADKQEYHHINWYSYVDDIVCFQEDIKDEELLDVIKKLENNAETIAKYLIKYPEKEGYVYKEMNEYLPVVLKLLNAYVTLEQTGLDKESFISAKQDIIDFISKLNEAFETKKSGLYENMAMDISSEVCAMKTILTKNGLINNHNFKSSK